MAQHGYNTRRSLLSALSKNPTPLKRPPAADDEEEDEHEGPLKLGMSTHEVVRAIRSRHQDELFMFSGDEQNASGEWRDGAGG
jgi:hypothetical protein